MGLFSKTPEQKAAVTEYKRAHRELNDNSDREHKAGIREETEEYHRLNRAACDAAANPDMPKWWW